MPENLVSVVLVTNAGQGYGLAIALAYGMADYDVICVDKDVGLASKTAAEIEELGGNAIPVQADISTHADVQKVFERVYEIFGDLSGIVHVVGSDNYHSFEHLSEGELNDLWIGNIKSSFLLLRHTQRYLSEGWFVLVSPPQLHNGIHIESMKGALDNFIRQAAKSYPNLNSNMVVPSRPASTPYYDDALVRSVIFLGTDDHGISGQHLHIELPDPPEVIESLLPEVRAALDSSLRQDDDNSASESGYESNNIQFIGSYIQEDTHQDGNDTAYAPHTIQTDDFISHPWADTNDWDIHQSSHNNQTLPSEISELPHYTDEPILDDSKLEPLNFEDTEAQLEAALASDPDNQWYRKDQPTTSTPASRAVPNHRKTRDENEE